MYADRIVAGSKRSIKDRLNGDLDDDLRGSRPATIKRQRQSDDKWKHDLYDDAKEQQTSKLKVGPKDLRLKLQKKASQQVYQDGKAPGVRDLREKLSGVRHAHVPSPNLPKAKVITGSSKPVEKSSAKVPVLEPKKTSEPTSSRKNSQLKSDPSVDGFLKSMGLEKYLLTFKAEEVDMAALKHMTDKDLKTLGIPMGPRKKILLALESRG